MGRRGAAGIGRWLGSPPELAEAGGRAGGKLTIMPRIMSKRREGSPGAGLAGQIRRGRRFDLRQQYRSCVPVCSVSLQGP